MSCVIVGCAPHLDDLDLSLLDGLCETFVCNRFYRCFPEPAFRPTYYVCADRRVWRREAQEVRGRPVICLLGDVLFDTKVPGVHNWVPGRAGRRTDPLGEGACEPPDIPWYGYGTIHRTGDLKFSVDPEKGFQQAGTVAYDMLQWAVYMGFTTIGLVGIDLAWPKGTDGNRKDNVVTHAGGMNGWEHDAFPLYTDYNLKYFRYAAKVLPERGINIYNLAPGGKLDAFHRETLPAFADKLSVR